MCALPIHARLTQYLFDSFSCGNVHVYAVNVKLTGEKVPRLKNFHIYSSENKHHMQ